MAALLAGTSHCAQCVTDSVRVYVYVCVCVAQQDLRGAIRGHFVPGWAFYRVLLSQRDSQQGIILMLYSRHWQRKTAKTQQKKIGGKMSLSSNRLLACSHFHSNTVRGGHSSQIYKHHSLEHTDTHCTLKQEHQFSS